MKRLLFLLLSILLLAPLAYAGGYEDFSAFNLDWSGGNNSRLAFYSPLTSTSSILSPPRAYPGTAATFSRASAQYITDFEGVIRKVETGSVAVEGSRVVTNLLTYSEDLSNAAWVAYGSTKAANNTFLETVDNAEHACFYNEISSLKVGRTYRVSGSITGVGRTKVAFAMDGILYTRNVEDGSPTNILVEFTYANTYGPYLHIQSHNGTTNIFAGDTVKGFRINKLQVEEVFDSKVKNPSEYISTASAIVSKCFATNQHLYGVALGDSLTTGGQYIYRIHANSRISLENKGIVGNSLGAMHTRFASDVTPYAPSTVLLYGGVNNLRYGDDLATTQAALQELVADTLAINAVPVLFTIGPFKGDSEWSAAREVIRKAYNIWLASYAATNSYTLVDVDSILNAGDDTLKAEYDSGDHLHYSDAGYYAVGDLVLSLMLVSNTPLPQSYPERANSTAYALNDKVQVSGWWYYCTTAGTSAGSAPTFPQGKAGSQTVTDGTAVWTLGGRLLLGVAVEPASTNKTTSYGIIPADTLGSELSSGSLTIGQKYQITARTDADFTADGAADNVVGTQFVATAATVTLDAGDKVKRVQWGVGEKSFHNGTSFVQNISGLTLSGDMAGVLSIIDGTTLTTNAGLLAISSTGKLYQNDNTTGSAASVVTVTGTAGNTNKHSGSIYIAKISGSGTSTIEINGTTTTITGATLQRFKVENVTPASGSQFVINTGIGDKVQFCLMGYEESVFATSINPSLGSTSTRAATVLSYPVSGNLTSPLWSAKITATPATASQDGKFFLGSYLDANNSVGLLMSGANAVARKRIGGSNNDATKALALVAGATKRFGMRGSSSGWSLFVDGVKGTDSADTTTPVAGTSFQFGLDGNSGNAFYGYLRDFYLYNKPLADGRF